MAIINHQYLRSIIIIIIIIIIIEFITRKGFYQKDRACTRVLPYKCNNVIGVGAGPAGQVLAGPLFSR